MRGSPIFTWRRPCPPGSETRIPEWRRTLTTIKRNYLDILAGIYCCRTRMCMFVIMMRDIYFCGFIGTAIRSAN